MGNFTLSEILTIVLVILIVFGPNRLPELARKAGQWVSKARRAAIAMREEFVTEYGDAIEPLKEARDEIKTTGAELRGELQTVADDVKAAGEDVKAADEEAAAAAGDTGGTPGGGRRLERSDLEPPPTRETPPEGIEPPPSAEEPT